MAIGRGAVYRRLKELNREDGHEYLVSIGFTPDQATDFITDHEINTRAIERKPRDNSAFERMMEQLRARCEGKCLTQETDTAL